MYHGVMSELALTDSQRETLIKHRNAALEKEKLLKWLDELNNHKKEMMSAVESKIKSLQEDLEQYKKSHLEIEQYKDVIVKNTNSELQKILTDIVEELKLGSKAKIQLSFEGGVPRLMIIGPLTSNT